MPSLCGFIAIALTLLQVSDTATVGFAIERTGRWLVRADNVTEPVEVELGALLPPRGVLVPIRGSSQSAARLVVSLHDGTVATFTHEGILPARMQRAGTFTRIWDVILGRFTPRLINALSRGSELPDSILERSGDTLKLGPILGSIASDAIAIRLQPIGRQAEPAGNPHPVSRITGTDSVTVLGLSSGLFELAALRAVNDPEPIGTCWAYVCEGDECEVVRRVFVSAQQMTDAWGNEVRESTKRAVLRAALAGLQ